MAMPGFSRLAANSRLALFFLLVIVSLHGIPLLDHVRCAHQRMQGQLNNAPRGRMAVRLYEAIANPKLSCLAVKPRRLIRFVLGESVRHGVLQSHGLRQV